MKGLDLKKNSKRNMADITMCSGTNCPLKETCYRYKATPSSWQSYFSEPPFKDGECEYEYIIDASDNDLKTGAE